MSHRFSNNYTGSRFKHALTTNFQHLLFDTLMVLCWWFSVSLFNCQGSLQNGLCDASSVLVGVRLLVTLRIQPSPLASKLLAAPRKGEQSVSLSLPVHSLSTASPMQCLLVAAGVYGCRKAPEPNCKGEISMTQRWSRRRRTKVPTAAKADKVIPSYRLNSPTPTADQVEEENLQLPTVVKAEEGNTLLQVIAVGQVVLASPERQTVCAMETQNTNPGSMDPPAL